MDPTIYSCDETKFIRNLHGITLISHDQMVERADIASEILGHLIVAIRNCDWGAHLNFVGLLIASLFISKVGN